MGPLQKELFSFVVEAAQANYIGGITGYKEEKEINDSLGRIFNIAKKLVGSSDQAGFAREIRQELTKLTETNKGVSNEDWLKLTNVFLHVLEKKQATTIEQGMEDLSNFEKPKVEESKTDQKPAAPTTPKRPVGGVPVPGFGSPVKLSPRAVVSPRPVATPGAPSPKPSPIQMQPIAEEVPPRPFPRKPISDTPPPLPPRDDETPAGNQPSEHPAKSAGLPLLDLPLPPPPGSQNSMPVGRSPVKQGSGSFITRPLGTKPAPKQQPTAGEKPIQGEQPASGKTSGKIGADRLAFLNEKPYEPPRKRDSVFKNVNVKAITTNLEKFFAGLKADNDVFKKQIKEETKAYIEHIKDDLIGQAGAVEATVNDVYETIDRAATKATADIEQYIKNATRAGVDERITQRIFEDLQIGVLPNGMSLKSAFSLAVVANLYRECLLENLESWRKSYKRISDPEETRRRQNKERALNYFYYFHKNVKRIQLIGTYEDIGKEVRTLEARITARGDREKEEQKIKEHQDYIEKGNEEIALRTDHLIGDRNAGTRIEKPKEVPKWLLDGLES